MDSSNNSRDLNSIQQQLEEIRKRFNEQLHQQIEELERLPKCPNCHKPYREDKDEFCRFCGQKRDVAHSSPIGSGQADDTAQHQPTPNALRERLDTMQRLYGPMPVMLQYECPLCGLRWTGSNRAPESYCPQCGTYVSGRR